MNKSVYDYGHCHVCGEQMRERQINHDFWIKGELIVIEDVPTGVCQQCGEKVVNAEVGRQIATLTTNAKQATQTRTIQVPVFHFTAKVA
ncbi:MAG: type II toxin-antitoxin system MqsA family antitoxin [Acidobacteria bacterium]|nr:type II toxin-antitoxin system MqsA family antitoxin [Acidobacteriota bacterium]MBI3426165.1 type II toxin-antitoxin system MqsA family antitoxin [Acidobacteriota bacterium]